MYSLNHTRHSYFLASQGHIYINPNSSQAKSLSDRAGSKCPLCVRTAHPCKLGLAMATLRKDWTLQQELCKQEGRIISMDNLGKRTGGEVGRENRAL